MLTQCPACHTSFRITSSILRVAHGQVRCGRCDTQFDAIQHLVEEEELRHEDTVGAEQETQQPAEQAPEKEEPIVESDADIVVEEPLSEEITLEGRRIEISGVYRALEEDEAHTQTIVQEFAADGLTDNEDSAEAADDIASEDIASQEDTEEEEFADIDLGIQPDPHAELPPIRARESAIETPIYTAAPSKPVSTIEFDHLVDRPQKPPGTLHWTLLSFFGTLILAAQLIHHYRQDLSRRADFGPYLGQLYAALGIPLEPRWDLNGYAVKQWGVVSDPNSNTGSGGVLRVRASIANHGEFPQPYPLLKLTLEDRFGEQVGSREFKPEEYLSSAAQAKRLLNVGESANADIAIVDPGEEAVGFHLNVCLPVSAGLECAG